jgi:polar amino acid transport system substrate-binding protein
MHAWLATVIILLGGVQAQAQGLRLYTEEYPPITFARDGRADGLGTAVVREIMRRTGTEAPIEVVPWARAYHYATHDAGVGLFVTTRTAAREDLFKWVGPVTATRAALYKRRGDPLTLKATGDARTAGGIAVPRNWYLHQQLQAQSFANLVEVATPGEAIRLLAGGRVQLMALDDVTLATSRAAEKVGADVLVEALPLDDAIQYIAFSRGTDDALVARWQTTLGDMKQDGSYLTIYHDWLPGARPPGS